MMYALTCKNPPFENVEAIFWLELRVLVNIELEILREYKIAVSNGLVLVVKLSVNVDPIRVTDE